MLGYKLHKEGSTLVPLAGLVLLMLATAAYFIFYPGDYAWIFALAALFAAVMFGLVVNFFRNPARLIHVQAGAVLAPCDGKVVAIAVVQEPNYFKDERLQLSIFMSPLNVHVNRSPVGGTVKFMRYFPGKFLVAWHPKSSELNERTLVVVQQPDGAQVGFKQIAGGVARRIRWYLQEGDTLAQGQEFGFIKFGSRMDVLLPIGTSIVAKPGQKVLAGQSTLAVLTPPAAL